LGIAVLEWAYVRSRRPRGPVELMEPREPERELAAAIS
jgi:hypothetical protein